MAKTIKELMDRHAQLTGEVDAAEEILNWLLAGDNRFKERFGQDVVDRLATQIDDLILAPRLEEIGKIISTEIGDADEKSQAKKRKRS